MGMQCSSALAIYRLKVNYDTVWREILYSVLFSFGIPMKLVKLIKMKRVAESG